MTPKERILAADMLDRLGDLLANQSCNDWEWPRYWSPQERAAFVSECYRFNSGTTLKDGGPELDDLTHDIQRLGDRADTFGPPDFHVAHVLANMLREQP